MDWREIKLKICPFCGSSVEIYSTRISEGWWSATIDCKDIYEKRCSATMMGEGDTEAEAIQMVMRLWDARYISPEPLLANAAEPTLKDPNVEQAYCKGHFDERLTNQMFELGV